MALLTGNFEGSMFKSGMYLLSTLQSKQSMHFRICDNELLMKQILLILPTFLRNISFNFSIVT
jgi:hypothetical protein